MECYYCNCIFSCYDDIIPQTNHWACTKKNGLTSLIIGSLRDLRVNYYKNQARKKDITEEDKQLYTVVTQALKVILNASYGVMGAEIFPLYFLPAAESTTGMGRHIILDTIEKCKESGIDVLYGDTDSIFVKNLTKEQIDFLITRAKDDHNVELEDDKEYRYVVLSNRKKNYLGVTKDGKADVKGLTGKKSHTPKFIKTLFYELLDILAKVQNKDDFDSAKNQITKKIAGYASDTWGNEVRPCETDENINQPWHWIAIPIMGLTMGEIWYLKDLADDCEADKIYEFMFVGPALPITGAVGSPVNPLAIK